MSPIFIGKDENGAPLHLGDSDLETHVHGIGASRTGKSKLIEWLARAMIRNRQGFCLIDPHGFLYDDLVRWLAYLQPKREIILFEPADEHRIVGFNPFKKKDVAQLHTLVDRRVAATVKAWGATNSNDTPRLERWLRCLFFALMEQGLPLDVARYFLSWQQKQIREYLVQGIRSQTIRDEWTDLGSIRNVQDFWAQIESTKNRLLFRFIEPLQIRRTMSLDENSIDLKDIIETGKILLVNLQPKENRLSHENAHVIGTLLINEIWEITREREQARGGRPPSPFFLIIDEFQLFLTPDIPDMLDQAAKYGLHLFLFHQHLSQLKEADRRAYGALTNARIKIVFGGLSREDARIMAEEMFPGQIDLKSVKFLIEQTKFWPVYSRDTTYSSSRGSGSVSTSGTSESWNPTREEWVPSTSSVTGDNTMEQEGETNIPIFIPVPFKEVSSIETYSLDEMLWQLSDRLMDQYQRHYMIRTPGSRTRAAVTPYVQSWHVRPDTLAAYKDRISDRFLTAPEVDQALRRLHEDLSLKATGKCLPEDPGRMLEFSSTPPQTFWEENK